MLAIKKTFRWILYAAILLLTLCIIAGAIVRFVIFPNIDQYKADIATKISQKIGLKTTIGHIVADWDGVSPRLHISEINIHDQDNTSALHLENVKGTLSWLSIPMFQAHLSNLAIKNPKLTIHRKADGHIFVAGIPLTGKGEPVLANWALSQQNINISNASIVWLDDMRQAPALSLDQLNLKLENPAWRQLFGHHLFTLSALPSAGTKLPITVNGDFFGRDAAKVKTWNGHFNFKSKNIDVTAWKNWIDYPLDLQNGIGNMNVDLAFANSKINKVKATIAFKDLLGKISPDKKTFDTKMLSGLITWEKKTKTTVINVENMNLETKDGLNINGASGVLSYIYKNKQPWINASAALESFDLRFLKTLNDTAPLPKAISKLLRNLAPSGQLNNTILSWQGSTKKPAKYLFKSNIKALSINAYDHIPGFKNLSGRINANERNGLLDIATKNASLDIQKVLRWPVPITKLNGKVTWVNNKGKVKVMTKNLAITNHHVGGTVNASYNMNGIKGGYLDIDGRFDNGKVKYAPFYYPNILNKKTTSWLDSSIVSGKVNNIKLIVKGHIKDFPYINKNNTLNPKLGTFKVTARVNDAVLKYGNSWPQINGLGLDLLFEGNRMELNADKGKILGFNIAKSKVTIPELKTKVPFKQVLNIVSEGKGPITDGINFINSSPVKAVTLGFTDDLKTAGNGKLKLALSLPLNDINNATFKGNYQVIDGTMYADKTTGLPEIRHIFGQLNFDQNGISAEGLTGDILGGPASVAINTASDKTITIQAKGTMTASGLYKAEPNAITASLEGNANWTTDITIKKPLLNMRIRSDLVGMAVKLPSPLGKSAEQDAGFILTKKQTTADEDLFEASYNKAVAANIIRTLENGALTIHRGDIALNTPAQMPTATGLTVRGKFDYLNADEWLAISNSITSSSNTPVLSIHAADLSIKKLDIFNRSLNQLTLTAKPNNNHLQMALTSAELDGDVEWHHPSSNQDNGKLIARLKKLHIPTSNQEEDEPDTTPNDIRRLDRKYPALDIQANDFKLGKKSLGTLALNAYVNNEDWIIKKLTITNPESTLQADGTWHNWTRSPNTNLNFTLSTENIGDTLKRFGQTGAVKDGVALIAGRLQWPGSPHEFKKDGLSGEFALGASKGQILKVQPGVGRLLGLLTLQSLPRRLTLDFRDLFSEGFAFDEISGTAKINNGVMRSDDFFMTGPAAETMIRGETNLTTETQDLNVVVVPHISDSLSLAALAGGPLAGAAAWLAQKILKDPLNKIAQSEYRISGTWDKPVELEAEKEEKEIEVKKSPLNAQ